MVTLLTMSSWASAKAPAPAVASLPAWLSSFAGAVTITADSVVWQGLHLSAVEVPATLVRERVTVAGGRFELAGGVIEFSLAHDPDGESTLSAAGDGLQPGRFPGLETYVEGVPLAVSVELRGRGSSIGALARSATGTMRGRNASGGRLLRPGGQSTGSELLRVFTAALPFADDAAALAIECVALDWTFVDGRANVPLGVELLSPRIRVTGGGEIDLVDRALRIALHPRARAGFDPAGLAIANEIRVEGPFAAPVVRTDTGGLLGKAATYGGGAVATLSGARLLGVVREKSAGRSLCTSRP